MSTRFFLIVILSLSLVPCSVDDSAQENTASEQSSAGSTTEFFPLLQSILDHALICVFGGFDDGFRNRNVDQESQTYSLPIGII